jgi:4-hydroxy-tetrahydrodipicolinate reductase
MRAAAATVPVVRAANFSLGVAALRRALHAALEALPASFDVEIIERHHRLKRDSPSGTALRLARDVAAQRGGPEAMRHGREGAVGPRPAGEIGVHAVRGGDLVGDHTVLLAGPGEWLELRHVAQDRRAFAEGALAAARFVARARPGLYTLEEVLAPRPA